MDLYIRVKSSSYDHGESEKLSKISEETLECIKPLVHKLLETKNSWNWDYRTELKSINGSWKPVSRAYAMYKKFNIHPDIISKFIKYVPCNAEKIYEVEVLKLEKIDYKF